MFREAQPRNESSQSQLRPDILLVEDEEGFRLLVQRFLESAGYTVQAEPDGKAALRYLERSSPKLIVTDLFMPDANGIELMTWLCRSRLEIGVVAMCGATAEERELFEAMACNLGAHAMLHKPFALTDLLMAVYGAIGSPMAAVA